MMRRTLVYALLLAIPAGTTIGSGIFMMTGRGDLGLVVGVLLGCFVVALVILGREYGAADEGLAEGP
jgi:hypothetical protein